MQRPITVPSSRVRAANGSGLSAGLPRFALVHREHQRPVRRIEIEADDVDQLGLEVRVVGQLEGADLMRL